MNQDDKRRAAELLWRTRREERRIDHLPPELRPATLAEGYDIQDAMVAVSGRIATLSTCQARTAMKAVSTRAKSRRESTQRSNHARRRARRYGIATTSASPTTIHATPDCITRSPRTPTPCVAR